MRSGTSQKFGWLVTLILLCGFQLLFLPFYHFHPDNTHSHSEELSPHHHSGHFHSHELEGLGGALDAGTPAGDPANRDHDADDTEYVMAGSTALPKSFKLTVDTAPAPGPAPLPAHRTFRVSIVTANKAPPRGPVSLPSERSPPVYPV